MKAEPGAGPRAKDVETPLARFHCEMKIIFFCPEPGRSFYFAAVDGSHLGQLEQANYLK